MRSAYDCVFLLDNKGVYVKQIDCVVIPARGNSKRIVRKNMQPFCGIPMLERSIKLAHRLSDHVIVSSDELSMLEFAASLGAYPLVRDKALADDMTPTLPVVTHALLPFIHTDSFDESLLDFLHVNIQKTYTQDNQIQQEDFIESIKNMMQWQEDKPILHLTPHSKVLCLYATAMFATEQIILESCTLLDTNSNAAYVVAMLEASKVFRSFCLNGSGYLNFLFQDFINTRSQDLPQAFIDAGQFYLGKAESFLMQIPLLGEKSMGIKMAYAHDIDTMLDLAIAESLFKHINKDIL